MNDHDDRPKGASLGGEPVRPCEILANDVTSSTSEAAADQGVSEQGAQSGEQESGVKGMDDQEGSAGEGDVQTSGRTTRNHICLAQTAPRQHAKRRPSSQTFGEDFGCRWVVSGRFGVRAAIRAIGAVFEGVVTG